MKQSSTTKGYKLSETLMTVCPHRIIRPGDVCVIRFPVSCPSERCHLHRNLNLREQGTGATACLERQTYSTSDDALFFPLSTGGALSWSKDLAGKAGHRGLSGDVRSIRTHPKTNSNNRTLLLCRSTAVYEDLSLVLGNYHVVS